MLRAGEPELIESVRQSPVTLALHQADNGQIPKFVAGNGEADFWYVGCIDATLWWLIMLDAFAREQPKQNMRIALAINVKRALTWLHCQEHPTLRLLSQNEASDWADIMPRSGYVLYTNALWYHVKRLYGLPAQAQTRHHFNHLFFPFSRDVPSYRRLRLLTDYVRDRAEARALYLSYVNFSFWGEEGDVFGNVLALLMGLADAPRARGIVRALERADVSSPWPARATCVPIEPGSAQWRKYMGRHEQNFAYQYHNAGSWPLVGGFYVIALARFGNIRRAREALVHLAEACAVNDWQFNEWFHGETGEPRGMAGQSWSAAAFLLAYEALGLTPSIRTRGA